MVERGSSSPVRFRGFTPRVLEFLHRLSENNDRAWFLAHKTQYERDVLEPTLDFIHALVEPLARLSPRLLCIPKRSGGSLMRIYRDTRFARDKRPYKTNVGIHFRHDAFGDVHGPGCYFHIGTDECFLGAGIWRPDRVAVTKIRERILAHPRGWRALKRSTTRDGLFAFDGAALKRAPHGVPPDHPDVEDLKRKDFFVVRNFDESLLFTPDLVAFTTEHFARTAPLLRFLCASLGAEF